MKKLLSCAVLFCAMTLVGCSKANNSDNNTEGAATDSICTEQCGSCDNKVCQLTIDGDKLVDAEGNEVAHIVDGNFVDAEGNILGTVEEIKAKIESAKTDIENLPDQIVETAKDAAEQAVNNAVEGAQKAANEAINNAVNDAVNAGSKAVEDLKNSAVQKINEGASSLKK